MLVTLWWCYILHFLPRFVKQMQLYCTFQQGYYHLRRCTVILFENEFACTAHQITCVWNKGLIIIFIKHHLAYHSFTDFVCEYMIPSARKHTLVEWSMKGPSHSHFIKTVCMCFIIHFIFFCVFTYFIQFFLLRVNPPTVAGLTRHGGSTQRWDGGLAPICLKLFNHS